MGEFRKHRGILGMGPALTLLFFPSFFDGNALDDSPSSQFAEVSFPAFPVLWRLPQQLLFLRVCRIWGSFQEIENWHWDPAGMGTTGR